MSAHVEPGLRIGIALDVSERYELEQRRLDVLEREQAARAGRRTPQPHQGRLRGRAVARAAHSAQRRSPAGCTSSRRGGATPELLRRGWMAIDRNVKAQARIISDILDVSRISSGKLRLHREWIEPARAGERRRSTRLRVASAAKQLTSSSAPEGDHEPAWLDPTRFQQIVWNLLTNAIKFSQRGRRRSRSSLARAGRRAEALRCRTSVGASGADFLRAPVRPLHPERLARTIASTAGWDWACRSSSTWRNCMAAAWSPRAKGRARGPRFEVELQVAQTDTDAASATRGGRGSPFHPGELAAQRRWTSWWSRTTPMPARCFTSCWRTRGARVRLAADFDSAVQAATQELAGCAGQRHRPAGARWLRTGARASQRRAFDGRTAPACHRFDGLFRRSGPGSRIGCGLRCAPGQAAAAASVDRRYCRTGRRHARRCRNRWPLRPRWPAPAVHCTAGSLRSMANVAYLGNS